MARLPLVGVSSLSFQTFHPLARRKVEKTNFFVACKGLPSISQILIVESLNRAHSLQEKASAIQHAKKWLEQAGPIKNGNMLVEPLLAYARYLFESDARNIQTAAV